MLRRVELEDAKAITAIYNEYVIHSVATFDTEPLHEEMRSRIAAIAARFPYFVYEEEGEIVGYCYAHPWKEKAAYAHTLETTVYLSPGQVGRGIGKLLMKRLIEECRRDGYHALVACITETNEASNALHLGLGFKQVSHFEKVGLKFGRWLDVMDYELLLLP
ncbi:MAG: N-acetyltransferase family protein [Bacteroides sp.]|nr:N-acetyltransferase family protein [Bacteroides sp.]